MGDDLAFPTGFVFLLSGVLLLYQAAANTLTFQTLDVITGAVLLSLGIMIVCLATRTRWRWKKNFKNDTDKP